MWKCYQGIFDNESIFGFTVKLVSDSCGKSNGLDHWVWSIVTFSKVKQDSNQFQICKSNGLFLKLFLL